MLVQHPPDHAQADPLPALGHEQGLQLGQRHVGLLPHAGHEQGPGRRVQAARPAARRRLGGQSTARPLPAQELGHERQAHPETVGYLLARGAGLPARTRHTGA